jgi:polyhydroxybutyrate depolymerase
MRVQGVRLWIGTTVSLIALACSEPASEADTSPSGTAGTAAPLAGSFAATGGTLAGAMSAGQGGTIGVAPNAGAGGVSGMTGSATGGTAAPMAGTNAMPTGDAGAPVAGTGIMPVAGTMSLTGGTSSSPADAVPSDGCGNTSFPADGETTLDVAGVQREYVVELPAGYDPDRAYRLVFVWHGLGGTAAMTARSWYGLAAHADDSAIFIAGQAQQGGSQSGFASWAIAPDESDIDYVRAMLDWAEESYCVDTSRVFSVGMSNGGMFANIVGCELGDRFRATAPMSGGGPRGYAKMPCVGQVAVWISHGNMDNNVPFAYGEASRDYWAGANGCGDDTQPVTPDPCIEYQGCDDGYPVQFCEFDGGHMIPSFAGEAVWNFFARF